MTGTPGPVQVRLAELEAAVSGTYDHELHGVRAAATSLRLVGRGNPPQDRFRVGLEFELSGYRDLDGSARPYEDDALGWPEHRGKR